MKLIIGLGNPGKEYDHTRHNIGFMFVDKYIEYKNINVNWSNKFDGLYFESNINGEKTIFLKPQTFMNLSGDSVRKVMDYFKIGVDDILVINDDLDLKVGNFKLKSNGSCGGHNGLRDIEKKVDSQEYKRLKIGISKKSNVDTKDYVLSKFSSEELNLLDELFNTLYLVIDDYFKIPFNDLMSKYNRKNR